MSLTTDQSFLLDAIKQTVKKEAERLYEEQKQVLIKEFDRRKDEIVAGIVLHVQKYVQMERMQENLVITIRKDITP
jgi:hypothetical protein